MMKNLRSIDKKNNFEIKNLIFIIFRTQQGIYELKDKFLYFKLNILLIIFLNFQISINYLNSISSFVHLLSNFNVSNLKEFLFVEFSFHCLQLSLFNICH